MPRLGVRGGKIVALGQTPGRGDQHKLDTWPGLYDACELALESEECVCGGKDECLGCVLQAALRKAKG